MCDGKRNCCQNCTCCKCGELRRAYLKIDSRCIEDDNELAAQAYTCGESCNCCTCQKIAKDYIAEEKCMRKKRTAQKSGEGASTSAEVEVEIRDKKIYPGKPKIDVNITDKPPVATPTLVSGNITSSRPLINRQVDTPKDGLGPVMVTEAATKTSSPLHVETPKDVNIPKDVDKPKGDIGPIMITETATKTSAPRPIEESKKTSPSTVRVTIEETPIGKTRITEEPKTIQSSVAVAETKTGSPQQLEGPKITPIPIAVIGISSGKPRPHEELKSVPSQVVIENERERSKPVEELKMKPVPIAVIATSSEKARPIEEPKTKPIEGPKITPVPVVDTVTAPSKPRPAEDLNTIPAPIPVTETYTGRSVPRLETSAGNEKQIEEHNLRQFPIPATAQAGKSQQPESSKNTPVPVATVGNRLEVGKPEISERPEEGIIVSVKIPIVAVVQKTGGQKNDSRDEDKTNACPPNCNCCKDKKQNPDNEAKSQSIAKKDFPQMESVKPQQSTKPLPITSSEENRSRRSLTRKIERPHSENRMKNLVSQKESAHLLFSTDEEEHKETTDLTRKIERPQKDECVHHIETIPPPPSEEPRKEQRVCVCTKSSPINEEQMKKVLPQIEMIKPQIEALKPQQSAKLYVPNTSDEEGSKWNVIRKIERPHSADKVRRGQREDTSEYDEKSCKEGLTRKLERPEKEERVHRTEALPIPVSETPAKVPAVCLCKPPPVMEDRTKKDVPQMEIVKPQQTAKVLVPSTSDEDQGKWNVIRKIERPQSEDKVRRVRTEDTSEYDEKSNKGGLTRKIERPEKEERVHRTEALPIPVTETSAKVPAVCLCKPQPVMEDRTKKVIPQMEIVKPQQAAKVLAENNSDEDRGKWNVIRKIERPHSEDKVRRGQREDTSEYDEKSSKGGLTRKIERPEKEERVHQTGALPIPVTETPAKVPAVCLCKPPPVMEDRTKKDVPQMEIVKPQQTAKVLAPNTSDEDGGKWNVIRKIERPHSEDKVRRGQREDTSEYDEKSSKGRLTRKIERPEKEERVHRTEALPIPVTETSAKVPAVCLCKPQPVMEDRTKKDIPQMEIVKPQQAAKVLAENNSDEDRGKWNVIRKIERPHSEDKVRRGQTEDTSEYDEKSSKGGLTRKIERPEKEERVHRTEALPIPVTETPAKVSAVCSCKPPPLMEDRTKKDVPQMEIVKPQQTAKVLVPSTSDEDQGKWNVIRKIERPHSEDKVRRVRTEDTSEYDEKSNKGGLTRKIERPEKEERVHRTEALPIPVTETSAKVPAVCLCKPQPVMEDRTKKDIPQMEIVKPQQAAKVLAENNSDEDRGKWNVIRKIERPHSEDKVRRGQTEDTSEYDEKSSKRGLTRKIERPEKEERVHRTEALPIPVTETPAKVSAVCSCKPPPLMEDRTKKDVPQMEIVKPQQTAKVLVPSTSDEDQGKWNVIRKIERPHSEDKVRRVRTEDTSEYDEKSNKGGLTRKIERPEKEERVHRTEALPIPVSETPAKVPAVCLCKPPPVMEDRTKKDVPQMEIVKPQQTAKVLVPSTSDEDQGKWNVIRKIERPHSEDKVRRVRTEDTSEYDEKSNKGGLTRKIERPEKEERVHRREALPIPVTETPTKVPAVCLCKPPPVMDDRTKKDVPQMEIVKQQQTAKVLVPSTSDEDQDKWNVIRKIERPHSEDKVRRGQREDTSEYDEKSSKGGLTRKIERPEKEERVHRREALPIPVTETPTKVPAVCLCKPPPVMEDRTKKDVPQMEIVKPQQTAKVLAPNTSHEDQGKWNVIRKIERPHSEDKVRRGQTEDTSEYDEKSSKGGLTRKIERPEKEERVHRTEALPIPVTETPAKVPAVCLSKPPPVMEDRTKKDVPQMEIVKPQQTAKVLAPNTSDEDQGKWNVIRKIERPHSEDKVRRGQREDTSEYDEKSSKGGLTRKLERPEKEERVHRTEALPIPVTETSAKVPAVCLCKPQPVMEDRTKKDIPQMEIVKPPQAAKVLAPNNSDEDRGKWNVIRKIERPHSEDKVRRGQTEDTSEYDEKSSKGGLTRKIERPVKEEPSEKRERIYQIESNPNTTPSPPGAKTAKTFGDCNCVLPTALIENRTLKEIPQLETIKPIQRPKMPLSYDDAEDQDNKNLTRKIRRSTDERKGDDISDRRPRSLTRGFERPTKSYGDISPRIYSSPAAKTEKNQVPRLSMFKKLKQMFSSKKPEKPYVCKAGMDCKCCK